MATIERKATARWQGDLKSGKGSLTLPSGVFEDQRYSFHTRFGDEKGTNPEELLGAAHAGCFTMALAKLLGEAGHTAERLETVAVVSMSMGDGPPTISGIELQLRATVPGITREAFEKLAQVAKAGCVISRALSVPVSLDARLED
ncbi:MAG TPA: OsmC family protein [Xanthomonadaceae bacterium]|nr:OsmC family protein [Xanthomonadaceae bacterium]